MTRARVPFGRWESPVTIDTVTAGAVRFAQPAIAGAAVYWLESRPAEGGRSVLVHAGEGSPAEDLTTAPASVRTRANEYGGGAYAVRDGTVWFVDDQDGQIHTLDAAGATKRLTASADSRWADLRPDPARRRLLAIRERRREAAEPEHTLVAIDLASGAIDVLAAGHDFYASPRISPDGRSLAWLSWDHPHLPWTETRLWLAELTDEGLPRAPRCVAGGDKTSVFQPEFSPHGQLYFVSDASGWWNLWRLDAAAARQVVHEQAEFAFPQWQFGMSAYGFIDARTALCACVRDGCWRLVRVDLESGRLHRLNQPYTAVEHLSVNGRFAALLCGASDRPDQIVRIDTATGDAAVLKAARPERLAPGFISGPVPIEFATGRDATAHAFYYPPRNETHAAPPGERPPLRVKCHGGPTGAASTALDLRVQFWTSRGWAVLDVDYRGSTGYGRDYREQLYGRWGEADVEDCASGVRYLAGRELADAARATISGNSAGGYTVLCALAFTGAFSAGASYYGIADPAALFASSHKFEAHYDHWLFGEGRTGRSPLAQASRIRAPVIFFQGLDDRVVPPEQTARMVKAMRAAGTDVACLMFEGEGHGFRGAAAMRRALEAEHEFLARVLEPAGIPNLSP